MPESQNRAWSLPGGALEFGENIEDCLIREIKEETGLEINLLEMLYICDRITNGKHIVHLTFLMEKKGGVLTIGHEPELNSNPIKGVKLVPINQLVDYGFSIKFQELVISGFPDKGVYKGSITNIGL